ncbi:MAG: GDSL-type esterase/lipase family protein [Oligoflexia bacterium]|nr:GDSL-type esterase/lipase family protein [Oligoflexia bacterium]
MRMRIFGRFWVLAIISVFPAQALPSTPVKIKVACLGDSITFGAGLDPADSYPRQLGQLLGPKWEVTNFGHVGATLMNNGDLPYRKTPEFKAALASEPDVVIIMLGTNDTKPQNWDRHDRFEKDYRDLVTKFESLPTKPKVWLVHPCPVMGKNVYNIRNAPLSMEIPIIDRIAAELDASIINIYDAMIGKADLFPDNVHPNAQGARMIAQLVGGALVGKSRYQ